jgi:hypothetical protein
VREVRDVTSTVYRDDADTVRERLEELIAIRADEEARCNVGARPILVRRACRTAAGAAGIAGGLLMFGAGVVGCWPGQRSPLVSPTKILVGTWIAMAVGYVVGGVAEEARTHWPRIERFQLTSSPRHDLERLRATPASVGVMVSAARSEALAVSLPLGALALVMPLTIHWILWNVFFGGLFDANRAFDGWIELSVIMTGLAHVCLFACALSLSRKLAAAPDGMERSVARSAGWSALLYTTIASIFPGAVLIFIPCAITLLTGLVFVPLAFAHAGRRLAIERAAFANLA